MPPRDLRQLNEVLHAIRAGDADALDEVLHLVGRRMFALAKGITGNRADAEDVVSESFLKIARFISSFREDTSAYAWVMRIVRNTALDLLRKRKRTATENLDEFFHLTDERYSEERREEALLLEDALQKLDAEQKKFIYYRYYLDFSVREIAAETGMSKSAAERALLKAEEALGNFLKK